jgi:hypothetical protein
MSVYPDLSDEVELLLWQEAACGRHDDNKWDYDCDYCRAYYNSLAIREEQKIAQATEGIEMFNLITRLNKILTDSANAVHGGPMPNGMWSFHNIPELIIKLREEIEELKQKIERLENESLHK